MKQILRLGCICLLFCACVKQPEPKTGGLSEVDQFEARDPMKGLNQKIFSFNLGFDKFILRPVAQAYHYTPAPIRDRIGNFIDNLSEPANFMHGVLQANPDIAFTSFWRFFVNTTFGIGGINDFASLTHLKKNQDQNFGKTFARYGIKEGPYIVLPFYGPSTARNSVGKVADWFIDPLDPIITTNEDIAETLADGITTREDQFEVIDQLYYDSMDPYAATRAAYLQHNAFEN